MIWSVALTPEARRLLEEIQDRRIQQKLRDRMRTLSHEPEKQGKPLTGELHGLRTLRAVGQRYRIIYRLKQERVVVLVLALGIRKEGSKRDVYSLTKRLLRLRLLEPED